MQINVPSSVATVLACLLLVFNIEEASALPAPLPGIVTLPLIPFRRDLGAESDVHPQIRLQLAMNRNFKRFALLTGRDVPSDEELWHHLHRRMTGLSRRGDDGDDTEYADDSANAPGDQQTPIETTPVHHAKPPTSPDSLGVNVESNDVGYFTTIQLGTPLRDFRVVIDSGSADFWIQGANCHDKSGQPCAATHAYLTGNTSSTFVDTGKPWSIQYGSGDVAGHIVRENISINKFQLKNHTLGVAFVESDDFASYTAPYDGLLGLAQSKLSNQGVITPIEALANQGLLKGAITSYKIARVADHKHDGTITFGGMDITKYDPDSVITIPNVSKIGFWEGRIDSFELDGANLNLHNRTGIFDTGTTNILAPEQDAKQIHSAIPGARPDDQGGFTLPCDTTAVLALKIGGRTFKIDSRDLSSGPVDDKDASKDCVSTISFDSAIVKSHTEWLLGATFLKNVYMSTDVGNNSVTFADLV